MITYRKLTRDDFPLMQDFIHFCMSYGFEVIYDDFEHCIETNGLCYHVGMKKGDIKIDIDAHKVWSISVKDFENYLLDLIEKEEIETLEDL